MNKFRIVTNGFNYKVQRRVLFFIWIDEQHYWIDSRDGERLSSTTFNTMLEAQNHIERRRLELSKNNWKVVR
jgi:hypothetical protein